MSELRQRIKKLTPKPLWSLFRNIWLTWRHFGEAQSANFHPLRRKSITQVKKYKDAHKGQRAFIMGNGPSLAKTDVSLLAKEITFGMNRVYLAYPEWGFENDYFVSINNLVMEQASDDISKLNMPKFLSWRSHSLMKEDSSNVFLHTTYERPKFAKDLWARIWEGATVTYVALQVAYYMGFDPVILIGVDHNFNSKGKANSTVVSEGKDRDHFDSRYFGRGFRWQLPDLETSEVAYKMAREAFEADGRRVLDATIGGKLNVFPKVEYDLLF
jgi:hypothetical protein